MLLEHIIHAMFYIKANTTLIVCISFWQVDITSFKLLLDITLITYN